jgi:type VI secretion system protein ImpG
VDNRLLEYYNRELRYLRELGGEFARDFPKIAGRLGLDAFECADPYVERLLEGFAFLAARVQLKIDAEFPSFCEQLLGLVYPHYLGSTPSMAIVEFSPDERQGNLADGFVVSRGSSLRASPLQNEIGCEYRTAHDVTLWPIEVETLTMAASAGGPEANLSSSRPVKSTLRLRLRTTSGLPFARMSLDELTLFFRGGDSVAWRFFELVIGGTVAVASREPLGASWTKVDEAKLLPIGTADSESLLPSGPRAFQGYRLLHEYFAFPQRFLFARLTGLSRAVRACPGDQLDLLVALDRYEPTVEAAAKPSSVSLFCTPAVNLFPKSADRIQLGDSDHEYHVVADRARPLDFEVHSVTRVTGYGAKGDAVQEFLPFYRSRHGGVAAAAAAFYTVQRRERLASSRLRTQGPRSSYLGGEAFVALVDGRQGPFRAELRQLSVETLCTNRDLPLLMPIGQGETDFTMDSGAPVKAMRCVAGPSEPVASLAGGETSWRLISHLSLNYLAVTDVSQEEGALALRELLSLYANVADASSRRQIAGVRHTSTRPIVRRLPVDGPPSFVRGIEMTIDCDEASFEGTSAFVLGLVLAQFFARYVSINSFVETVIRTQQRGVIARWPLTVGRRPVL